MTYIRLVGVVEPGGVTGYRAQLVEHRCWEDGSACDCCEPIVIQTSPYLGDALLPADVRAGRWADGLGIPYHQ